MAQKICVCLPGRAVDRLKLLFRAPDAASEGHFGACGALDLQHLLLPNDLTQPFTLLLPLLLLLLPLPLLSPTPAAATASSARTAAAFVR
eukprot:COSAG06_NODE_41042_length_395_cov_3.091216_2_plen_89_part_01